MPATLTAPQVAPVVLIGELSSWERAVALYVSDMPTGYRYQGREDVNLLAWIEQGVIRLGRDEVRRRASFLAGYRRVWGRDLVTPEISRRHAARFPSARRLNAAEDSAAASVLSLAPVVRDLPVVIDGGCPLCDGTRQQWATWVIDAESEWYETGFRPCTLCQSKGGAA
ncbi:hypothetical protein [Streptomyces sp. NPDC094437]|uniref:hypothetical protein n=1 Tax=Streptomyces sp. NPDC094437 TaxID=3366060 RepID=UPI00382D4FA6